MTLPHNSDKIYMQGHKTYRFNTQCIVWHFFRVTPSSSRPFALLHHMTLSIIKNGSNAKHGYTVHVCTRNGKNVMK